jgi:phage gp36-like protein
MGDIIAKADVEARLSAATVRRLLDDDNDGVADTAAVNRLIDDAESKFCGSIGPVHTVAAVIAAQPREAKRICLDLVTAFAAQRHPTYVRADWTELMKAAERDLERLRKGASNLGVDGAPEPAANMGGEVLSGDPNDETPARHVFLYGMGDYS